jgi:hypothetical protein
MIPTYSYSFHGVYKPTHITGVPHIVQWYGFIQWDNYPTEFSFITIKGFYG